MEEDAGCLKCGKYHACQVINEGRKFTSTNKVYTIRRKVNCNSSFLVYLGTCKNAGANMCVSPPNLLTGGILATRGEI